MESEHLMLSILKNKENIATQILNQFDVDYDVFKNELGFVTSNPPQAEFNEDDDFDDERKQYGGQQRSQKAAAPGAAKTKTPVLDNFGRGYYPAGRKRLMPLLAAK